MVSILPGLHCPEDLATLLRLLAWTRKTTGDQTTISVMLTQSNDQSKMEELQHFHKLTHSTGQEGLFPVESEQIINLEIKNSSPSKKKRSRIKTRQMQCLNK